MRNPIIVLIALLAVPANAATYPENAKQVVAMCPSCEAIMLVSASGGKSVLVVKASAEDIERADALALAKQPTKTETVRETLEVKCESCKKALVLVVRRSKEAENAGDVVTARFFIREQPLAQASAPNWCVEEVIFNEHKGRFGDPSVTFLIKTSNGSKVSLTFVNNGNEIRVKGGW